MTEDQINRRWVEILLDTLSAEKPVTIGPRDASCFINALGALLAPTQQPSGEVTEDDKVCAERYRRLRARMAFVEGHNAPASMSMRSSIPAPNHDFNADFVGDRFDASVDAAIDAAIAAARAHGQDSGSLAESKSAVKAPRCY
ncbi:hypothetical protein LGN43_02885 [Burkholderia multivorans]|nr:hypothetical protein [Burkholderia multivorans]